jgi:mannose/fructose/N-acetylgalactosamine-specific phosphotransferase system component IID
LVPVQVSAPEQHTRLVVVQVVVEAHIQLEVVAEVDIAEQLVELQVVVRIVEQFDKVIPYLWQLAVHIAMLRHHEYSQQNQLQ